MENPNFKHLSELIIKGIEIKENKKSIKNQEEQFFLDIISSLQSIELNSINAENLGVNLMIYEEPYMRLIESILCQYYGEFPTVLMMWWCFENSEEGGKVFNLIDDDGKKFVIKTPKQLYKFIKQWKQ